MSGWVSDREESSVLYILPPTIGDAVGSERRGGSGAVSESVRVCEW